MATKKEKYLIQCFKACGMPRQNAIECLMFLDSEAKQDKLLDWIKSHITATPEEVYENALEMSV